MKKQFDMHGWLRKQWQKDRDLKEEQQPLTEEYIEVIKDGWLEWKNGPMTQKSDIKPAQKELMKYMVDWMKKNIK